MATRWSQILKDKARALKRETLALYFAVRDPRTPLAAKVLAAVVVAYALSPIDLIPDFIPVLGYLDDLVLVPLGIAIYLRLIPEEILAEARLRAEAVATRPKSYSAAVVIIALWIGASVLFSVWLCSLFRAN